MALRDTARRITSAQSANRRAVCRACVLPECGSAVVLGCGNSAGCARAGGFRECECECERERECECELPCEFECECECECECVCICVCESKLY